MRIYFFMLLSLIPLSSSLQLPRSQVTKILLSGFFGINTFGAFVIDQSTTSSSSLKQATEMAATSSDKTVRVLLNGGDNMMGRAVQLSFPVQAPGEESIRDSCPAAHYIDMCLHPSGHPGGDLSLKQIREQNKNGAYLWGDYLDKLSTISPPPDLRILNFESAITKSIANSDVPRFKRINYHTHVDNLDPMMRPFSEATHGGNTASPAVLSFANNHCFDYGRKAFEEETVPALHHSPLFKAVGSGMNWSEATKPAVIQCGDKAVVEVFALSSGCSGTPESWHATRKKSGLVGIPGLYNKRAVNQAIKIAKEAFSTHPSPSSEGRLRVVSIHMGPNWAMKGEDEEELDARREFVHRLIDECQVDLIYGHSSHHVRGMEVYHDKLILYGTGDIINDYEGFENPGEDIYNRLGGVYIVDMNAETGNFEHLKIVPMFMNRLRLERFTKSSKIWRPRARRLEADASKSEHMCKFINELSRLDSGKSDHALVMEHVESDAEIPGGPVLVSKPSSPEEAAS